MIWAIVENEKIEAIPNTKGICPLCEGKVFSKCGEVNVWHWAHFNNENCDSWYEPESFWHKHWKMTFGKENAEVGIKRDGKRHIADILTNENVVIELQNSPIQKPIIREREIFYGERMIWVVNGKHFKDNFGIHPSRFDYDKNYLKTPDGVVDKTTGEIVSPPKYELYFSWSWVRKSWNEVQRPVFIDFGDENLFWVKDGMGKSYGKGLRVKKEEFLKKYGGDVSQLSLIIEESK